ncbi:MAG: hypothetical protein CM15mV141_320 [uncultured marine virus]|nr:MAG: hypothetical protein CM15mV141_320 [uncultured marine virus]
MSIIGKGTAGIIAVNHFASYTNPDELEIECYYDSNKPEQTVGEGTTVDFPQTLNNTQDLQFHEFLNYVMVILKLAYIISDGVKRLYAHIPQSQNVKFI